MKRLACLGTASVVLAMALITTSAPAGAVTAAQVRSKVLTLSNMPTGWEKNPIKPPPSGCTEAPSLARHDVRIIVRYDDHGEPTINEAVESGPSAGAFYKTAVKRIATCHAFTTTYNGQAITAAVQALTFRKVADASSAYAITFKLDGVALGLDVVYFRQGSYDGIVVLGDLGIPSVSLLRAFVVEAADKVEGKRVTPPTVAPPT
jgi:hypothetical protein